METRTQLAKRIAALSPQRREALDRLLRREQVSSALVPIVAQPRTSDTFPLSYAQQRLWLFLQLEPDNASYHIPVNFRLRGPLDVDVLERALNAVVQRHESLRTSFILVDEQPVQVIAPTLIVPLPVVDLRGITEDSQQVKVEQLAREEVSRRFDLTRGPLLRATLLRLRDDDQVLLLTMHHLITDGWSMGIFAREFATSYEALARGVHAALPDLPIQYADYVHWQRQWLTDGALQAQGNYWKQQLGGVPVLELPVDYPRPSVQTFRGRTEQVQFDTDLTAKLRSLSRQADVTMFMTLVAAYTVLLSRSTGQEDIVVGCPTANRNRSETDTVIGFFVNMLVLRFDLTGDPTFQELLARVRHVTTDAYTHQDFPIERLIEELRLKRDLSRNPLVQAAFTFENLAVFTAEFAGLTISPFLVESGTAKTDLTLALGETPEGLRGVLEYNTDLFAPATIARFRNDFGKLLYAIVADPQLPLSQLYIQANLQAPAPKVSQSRQDKFEELLQRTNLTKNQLQMWLGHNLDPDKPIYNNGGMMTILGRVEPEHFLKAMETLINSSDSLRTVFKEIDGVPQRRVLPQLSNSVPYLDMSSSADPVREAREWCVRRFCTPFDLHQPPYEFALIKITDEEYGWYYNTHQIVVDAVSAAWIIRTLSHLYQLSLDGQLPAQIELPQFEEYINSERAYLESPRYRKAKAHWDAKLADTWEPVAFYGKTPVKETTQVEKHYCDLGVERTQRLKAAALSLSNTTNTEDMAVFNLLLALLATCFYRISGTRQLSIGIPLHNRRSKNTKQCIGSFMQVAPLRIELRDDDRVSSLIERMISLIFENVRYGQYVVRNSQSSPLYDITVNYHPESFPTFNNAPLIPTAYLHPGHGYDSLGIQIRDFGSSGSLMVDFDFHCDAFDPNQRLRTMQHFLAIVDSFLADTTQRLGNLNMTSPDEVQRVLVDINRTEMHTDQQLTVVQLFEQQVRRAPDSTAIVCDNQTMSYADLNARSTRLARYLRHRGVGPESIVAICFDRSVHMVVALFGILKAGGTYLPLDPAYPRERLRFILEDAGASLLLTTSELAAVLGHAVAHIIVGTEWDANEEAQAELFDSEGMTEHAAYIIYTSGSTGEPKGVVVSHRALANFAEAAVKAYDITAADRILQFASIGFDAAAEEIYPCLIAGGTLVLRTDDMMESASAFLATCQTWHVRVLDLPTAYWHQLVSEVVAHHIQLPHSLRLVIIGGEKALVEHVKTWQRSVGFRPRLVNSYGPTETTVVATAYDCTSPRAMETPLRDVPIGLPIGNVQVYILDPSLQPVPIGVPGDLYIGGAGLARGYFKHSGLTAEKFLPNPFNDQPGSRLYKTGDVARCLSDGNIEFLGRSDNQVKIHGFRIELGEIEASLVQHPDIREAVVIALQERAETKRLVAYLVSDPSKSVSAHDVQRFLRDKLPDYMVPTAYVFMEKLPLTTANKVDRRALPEPDQHHVRVAYVAPRTAAEQVLADLWAAVLNVDKVGIHDNFFELGGDSILGIQIIARARRAGLQFTPKQLFQFQTVAELAAGATAAVTIEAEQGEVTGSVALTPIQQWFFEQPLAEPHHFNMGVMLRVRQAIDATMLQRAFQALIAQHDALRLRFMREPGGWHQSHTEGPISVPFQVIDLRHLSREAQREALESHAAQVQRNLSLPDSILVRAVLFVLEQAQDNRLLVVIHHLVVDGVSWRILLEDLHAACQQQLQGFPIQLGAKTTSFRQWVERVTEQVHAGAFKGETAYWQGLAAAPPSLPVDYHQGPNTIESTHAVSAVLDENRTTALLHRVGKAYRTEIQDLLLTAFVRSFVSWTGEGSLLIALEGHGREEIVDRVDISRTVGWFTSMYPVVLHTASESNPGVSLKAVKEQLRQIPNRGIGYGLLRYLSPDETTRAQLQAIPHPQVSFNYLGQLDQVLPSDALFTLAEESSGVAFGPRNLRSHVLDVSALITEGRLSIHWAFSVNVHRQATIEALARGYVRELEMLIDHCLSPDAGGYTPSDFPLAQLTQDKLDVLTQTLSREIDGIYPLSPMQEGMLFHSLSAPESGMYVSQVSAEIAGDIDANAFEQAWRQVTARHAILRTSLSWQGLSRPLQCVHHHIDLRLEHHDWRKVSREDEGAYTTRFLATDQARGFTLTQPPLMRLAWISLPGERYRFLWSFHHAILDGWSSSLLLGEVLQTYEALRAGRRPMLPPGRPYQDYIAWLERQDRAAAETFWRTYLQGFSAPTVLPGRTNRGRTNLNPTTDRQSQRLALSGETTTTLLRLTREHHFTPNTLIEAAWALMLSYCTGQQDVVIGVTVSGRPDEIEGIEQMVGLFINTLPLRLRIRPDESLISWLAQVQTQQIQLQQYEGTPLSQIQGWSEVVAGQPLFENHFIFENYPISQLLREKNTTLEITDLRINERDSFPLTVLCGVGETIAATLYYDADQFDGRAISRITNCFTWFLEQFARHPETSLQMLLATAAKEEEQLYRSWLTENKATNLQRLRTSRRTEIHIDE